MAWENKRKIHIARGTEASIINASASDKDENYFTDGQPLHIEGNRNYLGVASCANTVTWTIAPSLIEPIKVREVKGYIDDINTDHIFSLSANSDEKNMYIFADEKFESGTGNAYINVGENLGLSFRRKENEIAGIPQGNDYFLINPAYYLESENILTTDIKDIAGVNAITINNDIVLNKTLTTSKNVTISSGNLTSNTKTTLKTNTTISDQLTINAETTISDILKNQNSSTLIDFKNNEIKINEIIATDITVNNISTLSSLTSNQAIINTLYAGTTSANTNTSLYVTSDQVSINKPLTFSGSTFTINSSRDNTKFKGITIGTTSTSSSYTTTKIYGTLEVDCINLII